MNADQNTLPVPENTLSFLVRETIASLQNQGLLLTKEQVDEYRQLKKEREDEKLLGTEAAALLGVSAPMITAYRQDGLIKGYRIGRRWKYSKQELLEFKSRTA